MINGIVRKTNLLKRSSLITKGESALLNDGIKFVVPDTDALTDCENGSTMPIV